MFVFWGQTGMWDLAGDGYEFISSNNKIQLSFSEVFALFLHFIHCIYDTYILLCVKFSQAKPIRIIYNVKKKWTHNIYYLISNKERDMAIWSETWKLICSLCLFGKTNTIM